MTVTGQEITAYVERVRAALADLPPQTRDELTEDLSEHLAEVAAEADGSLVDRLGEPEAYAAELRAAAGATGPASARSLDQRAATLLAGARARLRATDRRIGPVLGYASASEYLRLLRPAWWVLRGYLAAMLITVVTTGGSFGLLPRLGGSTLAALLLLAVCVVASVWLGRRTPQLSRWPRLAVGAGTGVLVVFALAGFVSLDDEQRNWTGGGHEAIAVQQPHPPDFYDSQGRPLLNPPRLFDQDGNPIWLGHPACDEVLYRSDGQPVRPYPYCPEQTPFRSAPQGSAPGAPAADPTPSGTPTASASPDPSGPVPPPTESVPASPGPTS
ncbi:hypothetical protein AWW66_12425 [Micromonospora rosaria]|uniref:Uncharacterized protein n=1 Tax=Micromonospora rosaria TaxID=47874 RepID=A0A136PT07_9ACTN|nr:hypothetical protein [Micromonospora rosaria]KXK61630.1 hypothetical protein AWW66_12425 [Micromonospora rosaria]